MSVNYCWEPVKLDTSQCFRAGTSSDHDALKDTFGEPAIITAASLPVLRAMHRATNQKESLWSCIVDVLERMDTEREYDGKAAIKVWAEY
jgi:hypothetical protein